MKITIEINCDNAAFDETDGEVCHILDNLHNRWMCYGVDDRLIKDTNGNTVGKATVTE